MCYMDKSPPGIEVHLPHAAVVAGLGGWGDLGCSGCSAPASPKAEKSCEWGLVGVLPQSCRAPGGNKGVFSN